MSAVQDVFQFDQKTLSIPAEDRKWLELLFRHLKTSANKKTLLLSIYRRCNHWLELPTELMEKVDALMSLAFSGIVIFDDICDYTDKRCGAPTPHLIYGYSKTVNTCNYIFTSVFKAMCNTKDFQFVDTYIRQMSSFWIGQGLEIYGRDTSQCPTQDEYLTFVGQKFTGFVLFGTQCMQLLSNKSLNLDSCVKLQCKFFQIYNDVVNLYSKLYAADKGIGEDISTGSFNFCIIYAICSNRNDTEIIDILQQKTKNLKLVQQCLKKIESYGTYNYSINTLKNLIQEISEEITRLGGHPAVVEELEKTLQLENVLLMT